MIEKEYPVKIKALTEIQEFINNFCGDNFINTKAATKIAVCTDEVVSNVVYYSGADYLRIQCSFEEKTVSVSFIDNGKPFNPLTDSEAPDIGAGLDERKIGGLGIHIVKEMMDSVEYARNDNKNIFTIKISG